MCIKKVYYNTYGDGSKDVTERTDTCRPGHLCARPEIVEYKRKFRFDKLSEHGDSDAPSSSSLPDRRATQYQPGLFPPTPRQSKSPSPSSPRRRREETIYVDGTPMVNVINETTTVPKLKRRSTARRDDRGPVVVPFAPEPPSPRIIKRTSTMPADYVAVEATPPRPSRTSSSRRATRDNYVPAGPVPHYEEDLGSRRRSSSRRDSDDAVYFRRPARVATSMQQPPQLAPEYTAVDDAAERRRRREERRAARQAEQAAPSSDFSYTSGSTATAATGSSPSRYARGAATGLTAESAATAAVRKELRFDDQVSARVAEQNKRIAARNKPALHQEVKGILKKEATATGAVAPRDTEVEELRRAVERLETKKKQREHKEQRADDEFYERLRDRFEPDNGSGGERRRKSRVYYGGGQYGYE